MTKDELVRAWMESKCSVSVAKERCVRPKMDLAARMDEKEDLHRTLRTKYPNQVIVVGDKAVVILSTEVILDGDGIHILDLAVDAAVAVVDGNTFFVKDSSTYPSGEVEARS